MRLVADANVLLAAVLGGRAKAMAALPVTVVEEAIYASAVPQARKLIAQRDPDDVDVLALALHLDLPLWSNDNDFDGTGIEWYTTAELLSQLGLSKQSG